MENNQLKDDQDTDLLLMGWPELFKRELALDEREEKINRDGKRWLERARAREAAARKREAAVEKREAAVRKQAARLSNRITNRKRLSHMQVRKSLENFFPDFNKRTKEIIGQLEADPSLIDLHGYLSPLEQPLTQYMDPRTAERVLVAYYGPLQYMEQVLRAPGLLGGEIYTRVVDLMSRIRDEMAKIITPEELLQRTLNYQVRFNPGANRGLPTYIPRTICAPIRGMRMTGRNRRSNC